MVLSLLPSARRVRSSYRSMVAIETVRGLAVGLDMSS